jgi:hypothetical protein
LSEFNTRPSGAVLLLRVSCNEALTVQISL